MISEANWPVSQLPIVHHEDAVDARRRCDRPQKSIAAVIEKVRPDDDDISVGYRIRQERTYGELISKRRASPGF
jgi:hypothetical protein